MIDPIRLLRRKKQHWPHSVHLLGFWVPYLLPLLLLFGSSEEETDTATSLSYDVTWINCWDAPYFFSDLDSVQNTFFGCLLNKLLRLQQQCQYTYIGRLDDCWVLCSTTKQMQIGIPKHNMIQICLHVRNQLRIQEA